MASEMSQERFTGSIGKQPKSSAWAQRNTRRRRVRPAQRRIPTRAAAGRAVRRGLGAEHATRPRRRGRKAPRQEAPSGGARPCLHEQRADFPRAEGHQQPLGAADARPQAQPDLLHRQPPGVPHVGRAGAHPRPQLVRGGVEVLQHFLDFRPPAPYIIRLYRSAILGGTP